MRIVTITKDNLISSDPYKSTYIYEFPRGTIHLKDHEISIIQANVWNSIYTVTTLFDNNTFQYKFPTSTGMAGPYNVVLPDGTYTIAQLNDFLYYTFIQNNHYLINGSGDYVIYAEFLSNPTKNLIQLITYPVPTALPLGYSLPVGATWALPLASLTPEIVIFTPDDVTKTLQFGNLIGFAGGTYPPAPSSVIYTILGTKQDNLYPITSLNIEIDIANNELVIPHNQIYSFPIDQDFGKLITSQSFSDMIWVPIKAGDYNSFVMRFMDQSGNRIYFRDTSNTITVGIRRKPGTKNEFST
jgi:hypothetical protein